MTSPIEKQQKHTSVPVVARRDWCCGTPITGPHAAGCAYEPEGKLDYTAPVEIAEPPAADPAPGAGVPAASGISEPRKKKYGFRKRREFDVDLPSGDVVLVRQLTMTEVIELDVLNMRDSFAAELFKGVDGGDAEQVGQALETAESALLDPERREKFFGPLNRVTAAAVVCPRVVLVGVTDDEQINVNEIDLIDKRIIFEAAMPDEMKTAALEAQHEALKRVRAEQASGLGSVGDGQDLREAAD
ncbi:hypothetical protein [Mycobacterium asiaticum]|uniref:Uncharacterized protein n=1 Tax=Mycobacterium asiaticum TaxID=1790 RepID=A0A1A3MW14_MYCAS|nr:hypothetical protein [Mycobacterium asiaticum]OBK14093.1 hypothetical protein A5635_10385 [Mycobacterium asiaticum]